MRLTHLFAPLCTIALIACSASDGGDPTGDSKTLKLEANGDGSLSYCDDSGNCTSLPNPDRCVTLTITIDTASGKACQVCTAADGSVGDKNCTKPAVACDVVTIPDPDCVVCAYVNGTVIYSTCQPSPPICYTTNADDSVASSGDPTGVSGSVGSSPPVDNKGTPIAPPRGCTVCVDSTGKRVSQDCPPQCETLAACPAVDCAPGYRLVTGPGDCCGHCEPIVECPLVACAMMVPVCPDAQWLVKDPDNCCGWHCEPRGCSDTLVCTDVFLRCEPGYVVSYAPPHCCGACVPATDCTDDTDCPENEYCAQPECPCIGGTPEGACVFDPSCHKTCISDGAAF